MPAAARIGDDHLCPMSDGPKPHKGGPILPSGCVTVLIGGKPAARAGDSAACAGPPDAIAKGSPTVFIGYEEAARIGDATEHGGAVLQGESSVVIGDTGDGEPFTVWRPGAGQGASPAQSTGPAADAAQGPAAKPVQRPAPPQVAALRAAAAQGRPFCEVCERKRRRRRTADHERERA